jgi:hypothetical protein
MEGTQLSFEELHWRERTPAEILAAAHTLREYHAQGLLGGQRMPEDANPGLPNASKEHFQYLTLPMALNYQRNSYALWESALHTYRDPMTTFVFDPHQVVQASDDTLRLALVKHRVALQPNRHVFIWQTLCRTLVAYYDGDIRNLFAVCDYDIGRILDEVQVKHKQDFPYLSGQKIAHYWLYVMLQYTSAPLKQRNLLSIAPDTHVIQASIALGMVQKRDDLASLRTQVARAWNEILAGSDLCPIDVHTPLWLWSRNNFFPRVYSSD